MPPRRAVPILALLLAFALPAFADAPVGYRGDGSGVFPNAAPPTSFDEKTGNNILWKTPLPHFGHSSPIAIADRVFVTCESGWQNDFPLLLCLDATTGKILWQRELNHLPASSLSPEQQAKVAATWHAWLDKWRLGYACMYDSRHGDDAARAAANQRAKQAGIIARGHGDELGTGEFNIKDKSVTDVLKTAGIMGETFREGGSLGVSCLGHAFATPVSDGRLVYAATAHGGFFAIDLEGKPQWIKHVPGTMGEYCRNGRSPILYKDLLISDITGLVRAFDKTTGQLKWSAPDSTDTIAAATVITVDSKDILLCPGLKAFSLPDGKPLTVEGWANSGGTMLTRYDQRDTVFFTGRGEHGGWENKGDCDTPPPAAVRFTLADNKLSAKVLWSGAAGEKICNHTGITYFDNKLFLARGLILDANTGKLIAGSTAGKSGGATPATKHLLLIANNHVYGIRESGGRKAEQVTGLVEVFTTAGKKISQNTLAPAPVQGEKQKQIRQTVAHDSWGFSYSCPFTIAGNRLYIRSNDYLFCIAPN